MDRCKREGCDNYPGPSYVKTGYCGKHQSFTSVASKRTLKRTLKADSINPATITIDWDSTGDPWEKINTALGMDHWQLLESHVRGEDEMWATYHDEDLMADLKEAGAKVDTVIDLVRERLEECEYNYNDEAPKTGVGSQFWASNYNDLSLPVAAWELAQFDTDAGKELAIYLKTIDEASDPDELTWFELAVSDGAMWSGKTKELVN